MVLPITASDVFEYFKQLWIYVVQHKLNLSQWSSDCDINIVQVT